MKGNKYLIIFFLIILSLFSYRFTLSYFSLTSASTVNILAASDVFPTLTGSITPTVIEITNMPTLTLTLTPTPIGLTNTPTPTTTPSVANHVVISEVQISGVGSGNSDNDFVEFYNPTSLPFDLNGHRLVKRTGSSPNDTTLKSWTTSAVIPARGYYLWSNSSIAMIISADTSTTGTIAASNSIALRQGSEDTGTLVDSLSWNSASQSLKEGTEFSPNPSGGQSMERKAYLTSNAPAMGSAGTDELKGNGFDSNNNATDFYLRTVSQPQNSSSLTETP